MQYTIKSKLNLVALVVTGCFVLTACGGGGGGGGAAAPTPTPALDTITKLNEAPPTAGFLGAGVAKDGKEHSVEVNTGKDLTNPLTPTAYAEYTISEGATARELSASGAKKIKESGNKRLGLRKILVKDGAVTGVVSGNVKAIFATKMEQFRNLAVDEIDTNAKINSTEIGGGSNGNVKVITNVAQAGEAAFASRTGDDGRTKYWIIDPVTAGWNYQTYAGFENTQDTLSAAGGFQSFGTLTTDLPNDGTATYTGKSSAKVSTHDASGVVGGARLVSDVTVKADFAKRSLDFTTSNTKGVTVGNDIYTDDGFDKYNLSGQASWEDSSNVFKGNVATTGAEKFQGDINGRFYGGKAAEIGGTYGLVSEDKSKAITGGFGAKRP